MTANGSHRPCSTGHGVVFGGVRLARGLAAPERAAASLPSACHFSSGSEVADLRPLRSAPPQLAGVLSGRLGIRARGLCREQVCALVCAETRTCSYSTLVSFCVVPSEREIQGELSRFRLLSRERDIDSSEDSMGGASKSLLHCLCASEMCLTMPQDGKLNAGFKKKKSLRVHSSALDLRIGQHVSVDSLIGWRPS